MFVVQNSVIDGWKPMKGFPCFHAKSRVGGGDGSNNFIMSLLPTRSKSAHSSRNVGNVHLHACLDQAQLYTEYPSHHAVSSTTIYTKVDSQTTCSALQKDSTAGRSREVG